MIYISEHELAKELGVTVNHIVERTFSQPFGRAIYTFGSVSRLPRDEYWVSPLELQVKFVPHNVTYPPDPTKIYPEARQWAEFHNGVAASLRINPFALGVDSSWIAFNKPQELTAEHAGYLLGLGLTGHLRSMWSWHGYRYLVPKHELTSIAVLLGLSSAHAGSAHPEVTRLVTVHLRPLLPPDSAELGIPLGAQSAALMGLGLLYLGKGDRAMADVAMKELGEAHLSNGPEISNEHREAYTLTAGLAYGLIMCGLGSRSAAPSDDHHTAQLRAYISGKELTGSPSVSTTPPRPSSGLNFNLVSPAATIALALRFLKTNRADIAASLSIPADAAGLREVQPSLLLLRALGRSLIMWDEITPTVAWVLSLAQRTPKDMPRKQLHEGFKESFEFAFFNILSGACMAIGLKYAGTATSAANHVLLHFHDKLLENLRRQATGKSIM
jgi:anaphase-promoting complex subunit 1